MRLKRSRLRQYYHKKRVTVKDGEGGTSETFGPTLSFTAEVWPAGGKLQAEIYGERLPYVRNIRINEKYTVQIDKKGMAHYMLASGADITESDGICLYVSGESEPDYRIVSIRPYRFLCLEVEKR